MCDHRELTVLIVDDNQVNLRMASVFLEKEGYRTLLATHGKECFQVLESQRPDLILLDISMPGMSGIDVCRFLKQESNFKGIPVIFVTANTDDGTLKEAFESGGVDFIRKPFSRMELLVRIKSVFTQGDLMKSIVEEERLKGIIQTAGAVCHEMNQPLQVISAISEIILLGIQEANPLYDNLARMRDQVHRMGAITKKLQHITKYETKGYVRGEKIIDIDRASAY